MTVIFSSNPASITTKCVSPSNDKASGTAIVSSKRPFDGLDFERDLPTTVEDVVALRAVRSATGRLSLAEALEVLSRIGFLQMPRRRSTAAGWVEFSLD